jgi:hypothetical protein
MPDKLLQILAWLIVDGGAMLVIVGGVEFRLSVAMGLFLGLYLIFFMRLFGQLAQVF